jgi:CHAT domain-containing protein
VLASLWKVSDASTATLMTVLYRLREEQGVTKAEALRQAQLALLHGKHSAELSSTRGIAPAAAGVRARAPRFVAEPGRPFAHPFYWAPFILMGNWL